MDLSQIPEVRLNEDGVIFSYLVLRLEVGEEKRIVVRGFNYRPYKEGVEERIIQWLKEELDESGVPAQAGGLTVEGGGTLTLNPYYETITVYGANPKFGPEKDRTAVTALLEKAFPDYQVSNFPAEAEEEKKETPPRKTPPKSKKIAESEEN